MRAWAFALLSIPLVALGCSESPTGQDIASVPMAQWVTPASSVAEPVVDGYLADPVSGEVEASYTRTPMVDARSGTPAGTFYSTVGASGVAYFGFAEDTRYADNTYGVNAIGWHRPRDLDAMLRGTKLKVQMSDCAGELVLEFAMDYASRDRNGTIYSFGVQPGGGGGVSVGDAAAILQVGTSLEWNLNAATPHWPDLETTSPMRVPVNSYDAGTTADPNYPWIYEIAYEWAVDIAAFGGCIGAVTITDVVNAPSKRRMGNPQPVPADW